MTSAENEFLINVATLFLAYQRPAAKKATNPLHFCSTNHAPPLTDTSFKDLLLLC